VRRDPRVGRAHLHPRDDVRDLIVRKLLLHGHPELVGLADGPNEDALLGLPGNDGGTGVAALEESLAAVEEKAALHLVGLSAVALIAALNKNRPDLLLEEFDLVAGQRGSGLL